MRSLATLALAALATLGITAPAFAASAYKIDPNHTHVLFLVDHLGFSKMIGLFSDTTGTIVFDPANAAASKLNVDVKTASLQTQFGARDTDLKGADWFNVAEFPDMTFIGKTFTKKDDKTGEMTGDLTLLGVSKPVTLEVTFNKSGVRPTDKAERSAFPPVGR